MAKAYPEFKNILVVHFGQLGDVVLALPALRGIREKYPDARITLLLGKATGEAAKLARLSDDQILVDRVLLRDGNRLRSIASIFAVVRHIRSRRFDLIIDLHSLSETNLFGFLSRVKYRLYANREGRSLDWLSNFDPRPPREDKSKHAADRYFDVLKPLDIETSTRPFRFQPSAADIVHVNSAFFSRPVPGLDRSIGLFPGAGNPSRCWSLNNFAELATRFVEARLRPVVFLGPEEAAMKGEVAKRFPLDTLIVDGLTIPQFVAAVAVLAAFVGNDTGPIHLAACAGVPIVLLLDERAPTTYLPLTDELKVVRNQTIDRISVADVYSATIGLVNRSEPLPNDKSGAKW